jgi:hypothetical protein
MAKGVKKIKWTGQGIVKNELSVPNQKVVIAPDQDVFFQVGQWYESTPEADKKKAVTWMFQGWKKRNTILEKSVPAGYAYGIKIPKNLCGPFQYYVEASLYHKKDLANQTGLIVSGYCPPKIVTSKWCTSNDGTDVRKEHVFSYGDVIYLNLTTEGLNGHVNLSVDFCRLITGTNDPVIFTQKSVDVIDGEINIELSNTFKWYAQVIRPNPVDQFYVKVYDPANRRYITDSNKDTEHARFLRIKNKVTSTVTKTPSNLTPLKIGQADKNHQSYGFCKYITIKQNQKLVFDEADLRNGKKKENVIHLHYLAGGSDKNKTIKIELGAKAPGKCANHKGKVFDLMPLKKAGFMNVKKDSDDAFSFDVNFKYKHENDYIAFFKEYFLPSPAIEANLPLTTCVYRHLLDINVHPDVAWATHFKYDQPIGGFFRAIDVKIQNGLDDELKYLTPYLVEIINFQYSGLPDFITKFMADMIMDYFISTAQKFGFGIHAYHTFDESGNKPAVIMDYTAKYPWIAKTVIIYCVILSVLVDAIILYLTRGKGAATKIGKVASAASKYGGNVTIAMKRKGFEFITPKISVVRANYYEKQADGRIAFVQTEKVFALPLFGIQYEDKHTLGSLVTNVTGIAKVFDYARTAMTIFGHISLLKKLGKKFGGRNSAGSSGSGSGGASGDQGAGGEKKGPSIINTNDIKRGIDNLEEGIENSIDGLFEKIGQKLNFTITIKGKYEANYEVMINHLVGSVSIKDSLENYVNNSKGIIGRKKGIDAVASCELKAGYHVKTDWIMRYAPAFIKGVMPVVDNEARADGKAEIHGSLFFERKYTYAKPEPYYVDNVIFSGIAGTLSGSVKVVDDGKISKKKTIPETPFILMEPYVAKGQKISLLDDKIINEPKS